MECAYYTQEALLGHGPSIYPISSLPHFFAMNLSVCIKSRQHWLDKFDRKLADFLQGNYSLMLSGMDDNFNFVNYFATTCAYDLCT